MATQNPELGDLKLENFSPEHAEAVSRLLIKFAMHPREEGDIADELGLVFKASANDRVVKPAVDSIFEQHPELEDDRAEMDEAWWGRLSAKKKEEYQGDEAFLAQRREGSRFRVALASPYAEEIHKARVGHHFEKTEAQHRSVIWGRGEALGYLAVWSGASTLYLEDHMQVDAKVVDPNLPVENQRLVASVFEPVLYDLSLP